MKSVLAMLQILLLLSSSSVASRCNDKCGSAMSSKSSLSTGATVILSKSCYCDKPCLLFRDCCADANQTSMEETAYVAPKCSGDKRLIIERNLHPVHLSAATKGFSLISTCPKTTFDQLSHLCSYSEFQPVLSFNFMQSQYGMLFANPYCAACNNVPFENIKITLSCNSTITLPNLKENGIHPIPDNCNVYYKLSASQLTYKNGIRYCPKYLIETCSNSWNELYAPDNSYEVQQKVRNLRLELSSRCRTGPYAFRYGNLGQQITYRNQACAVCNEAVVTMCYTDIKQTKVQLHQHSFSLNSREMDELTKYYVDEISSVLCNPGYIYSIENSKCESQISNCSSIIVLPKKQFVINNNGSLLHVKSGRLLRPDTYILYKNSFVTCKTLTEAALVSIKNEPNNNSWITILGAILLSTAAVALFIAMTTTLAIPNLRHFCVLTVVSMCLALFFVNVMSLLELLFHMESLSACTIAANLKHYFALTYPMSQLILFLELWDKLRDILSNPRINRAVRNKTTKVVIKLSVLWLIPALIAVMTNLVEMANHKLQAANSFYCKNGVIGITNELVYLLFYLVPLCIIYTSTSILIIVCVDRLSKPNHRRVQLSPVANLVYKGISIATLSVISTCVRTFNYFVRIETLKMTVFVLQFSESCLLFGLMFLLPLIDVIKKNREDRSPEHQRPPIVQNNHLCVVKENNYVSTEIRNHTLDIDTLANGVFAYSPDKGPLIVQREAMLKTFSSGKPNNI